VPTTQDQLDALQLRLEESYEFHTRQLNDLRSDDVDPGSASLNEKLTSQSRLALSEIAQALRSMAEGRYGRCLDCEKDIPVEWLDIRPETRFCSSCQYAHDRQQAHGVEAA
jgi:RNA polymerase-binding transcription factor DksA